MVPSLTRQRTNRLYAKLARLAALLVILGMATACADEPAEARGPTLDRLPGAITDIARLDDGYGTIVAAVDRERGLYSSRDGGATWRAGQFLIPGVRIAAYSLAALRDARTVVAGTNRGIAHSSDSGRVWSFVWEGRPGALGMTLDPDVWPVAAADDGLRFGDSRGVTWEPSRSRLGGVSFLTVAADPADRNRLIAGTSGAGVLVTPDRGDTWTPVYPTRATVNRLVIQDNGVVYGLAGGLVLRWTDIAADPEVIALPPEQGRPIALAAVGRTVYAGTTSGDLVSLSPAPAVIDRLPAAISAVVATPGELCLGTTAGTVACRARQADGG